MQEALYTSGVWCYEIGVLVRLNLLFFQNGNTHYLSINWYVQQISIHCLYAIAVTKIIMSFKMFMVAVVICTVLEHLKTNSHTVVCLFGFSCHWHGVDLLDSDPVELQRYFSCWWHKIFIHSWRQSWTSVLVWTATPAEATVYIWPCSQCLEYVSWSWEKCNFDILYNFSFFFPL